LLRRQQVEAFRTAVARQPSLFFALREDHRPQRERTASCRYAQPNLLDLARS
jgi:hypothetical protein